MHDLSEFEDEEDIAYYSSLNEKCASWGEECWFNRIKISFDKFFCRYKFKQHVEHYKNLRLSDVDTYNPCPNLYTIKELNDWLND